MQSKFRRSWLGLGLSGSLSLLTLATGSGCHKPAPSPQFEHASKAFNSLYAQKLDEAYADPGMDAILSELGQVDPKSLDAQAATDLAKRIVDGRTRAVAEHAAREKLSLAARAPTPDMAFSRGTVSTVSGSPSPHDSTLQAGEPAAGMPFTDFQRRFGNCFELSTPINVTGWGMRDSYALVDSPSCRAQWPAFSQRLVVTDGKSISAVFPKSAVVQTQTPVPAEQAPANPAAVNAPAPAPAPLPPTQPDVTQANGQPVPVPGAPPAVTSSLDAGR